MAKVMYFTNTPASWHRGNNDAKLNGVASWWMPQLLSEARGDSGAGSAASAPALTVLGPTNGIEVVSGGTTPIEWLSEPLSADFTIAGTITLNLHANELTMNDNAAINAAIDKVDGATGAITRIATSTRVTEVALTTSAANNFTVTPTSTACKRGDCLRVRVFADDAGTMAAAGQMDFRYDALTVAGQGDSWVQFTENLTFEPVGNPGTTDQTNHASSVAFGLAAGSTERVAQPFVAKSANLTEIRAWLMINAGAPTDDIVVELQTDSAGSPSGSVVSTVATVAAASLTGTQAQFTWSGLSISVTQGATYWLLFRRSGALSSTNNFGVGSSTGGAPAGWVSAKFFASSAWTAVGNSLAIRVLPDVSTTYYLTNTDEPGLVTASIEKKASTTPGNGSVNSVTSTTPGGPQGPVTVRDPSGSSSQDWFTPPLEAFTLGGKAKFNIRGFESSASTKASLVGQIWICNGDGSGLTRWGMSGIEAKTTFGSAGEIGTADAAFVAWVAGDDTAVAAGKRLMLRLSTDDCADAPIVTARNVTVTYNGPTAGAAGDTYVILPVVVTEQITSTPLAIGKRAAGTTVGGVTLVAAGAAPVVIGRKAAATTARGVTVSGTGTVNVVIGKVGPAGVFGNTIVGGVFQAIGDTTSRAKWAQSFTYSKAFTINDLLLYLATLGGAPADNTVVDIQTDDGGSPNYPTGTVLGTYTFASSQLSGTYAWKSVGLGTIKGLSLDAGTRYWVVCSRSGAAGTPRVQWSGDLNVYADGSSAGYDSSAAPVWHANSTDLGFQVVIPTVYGITFVLPPQTVVIGKVGVLNQTLAPQSFSIGYDAARSRLAQPFVASGPRLQQISAWVNKIGSPTDAFVAEVWTDNAGVPGSVVGSVATIAGGSLASGWSNQTWACDIPLTPGVSYWLSFRRSSGTADVDNYFGVQGSSGALSGWLPFKYYDGAAWTTNLSSSIVQTRYDFGTSVKGVTLSGTGTVNVVIGKRAAASPVRGVTVTAAGTVPVVIGKRVAATTVSGVTVVGAPSTIQIGKEASATAVRGLTIAPIGAVTVIIGKKAVATTVRGVTLAVSGAAPIVIGKRTVATIVRGATVSAVGAAPIIIGKEASATVVRGVTLVVAGAAPIVIGKRAVATTVRGTTLVAVGAAPIVLGARASATVTRGVTVVGQASVVPIGRVVGGAAPDERMIDNTAPTTTAAGDYTVGAQFTIGSGGTGQITHIRYWNPDATRSHRLSVWTVSDSTKRATVTDPSSAIGWREVALPTPLAVTAGVAYVATYATENGDFSYSAILPTSLAPHLTGLTPIYAIGSEIFPTTNPGVFHYHVDVVYHANVAGGTTVRGVTLVPGAAAITLGKRAAATTVGGITLAPGPVTVTIGKKAAATTVRGATLVTGLATIPVGRVVTATNARGITLVATGAVPVIVGIRASSSSVRGVTLTGAGTVPLTVGRRAASTTVRGTTLVGVGTATPLVIGKRVAATTVRGITPVNQAPGTIPTGYKSAATVVKGITVVPTGTVTVVIGRRVGLAVVGGITLVPQGTLLPVGRRVSSTTVRGVTTTPTGTATVVIGGRAAATTVRGATLVPGPVTTQLGKVSSATTVRGITLAPAGALIPIGRRASTTAVRGLTLAPGVAPLNVGKRASATTVRGITFVATGVAFVPIGKKGAAAVVRGIVFVPGIATVVIGRCVAVVTVRGIVLLEESTLISDRKLKPGKIVHSHYGRARLVGNTEAIQLPLGKASIAVGDRGDIEMGGQENT